MSSGAETVKTEDVPMEIPLEGLEGAQQKFGPLLSPVPATTEAWTRYADSRSNTIQTYGNREDIEPQGGAPQELDEEEQGSESLRRKTSKHLKALEREMDFPLGTFSKGVSTLYSWVNLDDVFDDTNPRDGDVAARIYSPTTPACIDVYLNYHFRARFSMGSEWFWSLVYKIHRWPGKEVPDAAAVAQRFQKSREAPSGWKQIGGASFDGLQAERGAVRIAHRDVLDIHDALLGPIDKPSEDASEETKLAFRRQLVWCARLLMASVGIGYQVACTEPERDVGVGQDGMQWKLTIRERGGTWLARGIRKACGFELSKDPEEAQEFAALQKMR
ncbi:hypothetical protein CONPUDRAFT_168360 [Coniophora puteana RWD-64-598 SS2]|uniref:Uncharacterized protein n=1 Tax=Coniophora puteana (strain RWD-64-598) TaxID=741705 RepID=A0A5M3MET3_CONPW|nr:uncharacterized protein CONPUDRAFT_168360 [Coniophora puteana RWD-64-598 SS2]EIW77430.1 hypothetical protein CONPUDRAFT_168360 [Coniophora puteana RWD-64-598 SS2]